MKSKKTLVAMLALTLCISLSACYTSSTTDTNISVVSTTSSDDVRDDSVTSATPEFHENINSSTSNLDNNETSSSIDSSENSNLDISVVETSVVDVSSIDFELNEYGLELPINGATGYTSVELPLYLDETAENVETVLAPGTAFTILEEKENMWFVNVNDSVSGWIEHTYCMINLPDVIPSIVYDNTNSYDSMFRSVGNDIEGITHAKLYNASSYSNRFFAEQFMVPVLYSMSPKICSAQHEALKNGNTLVIYEGFRPYETQLQICHTLENLVATNSDVANHINDSTWGIYWFIASGVSNHQRGYAIDVSLAKVVQAKYQYCNTYMYLSITNYNEYDTPTPMHELSDLAVALSTPVDSKSRDAWKYVNLSPSMNEGAILLQNYCTESGLTPLASEWWHFNDLDALQSLGTNLGDGNFYITENKSKIPIK